MKVLTFTVQKHLSICVKYAKDAQSFTKFLGYVPIEDVKAHTIVQEVTSFLTKLGLDPGNIVSHCH